MLKIGSMLGAYRIKALIGAGATGEVYRAYDTTLERDVAIKVLGGTIARSPDSIARLRREARLLASVKHPHIGEIFSFEQSDGLCFLVLELIDGQTLKDRLKTNDPLTVAQALEYATQIAAALAATAAKGIIHRDLKPANIIVTPARQVKVVDFGVARSGPKVAVAVAGSIAERVRRGAAGNAGGTTEAAFAGTMSYLSPEQTPGYSEAVTPLSDQYALGVITYEMLSGRLPYNLRGKTPNDVFATICHDAPAPLTHVPRTLRHDIETVVFKSLEKRPDARFLSATQFCAELDRILTSRPIALVPPHPLTRLRRTMARQSRIAQAGVFGAWVYAILATFHAIMALLGVLAVGGWVAMPDQFLSDGFARDMLVGAVALLLAAALNLLIYWDYGNNADKGDMRLAAVALAWVLTTSAAVDCTSTAMGLNTFDPGSAAAVRLTQTTLFVLFALVGWMGSIIYGMALSASFRLRRLDQHGWGPYVGAERISTHWNDTGDSSGPPGPDDITIVAPS